MAKAERSWTDLLQNTPQLLVRVVSEWVKVVPHCSTEQNWILQRQYVLKSSFL